MKTQSEVKDKRWKQAAHGQEENLSLLSSGPSYYHLPCCWIGRETDFSGAIVIFSATDFSIFSATWVISFLSSLVGWVFLYLSLHHSLTHIHTLFHSIFESFSLSLSLRKQDADPGKDLIALFLICHRHTCQQKYTVTNTFTLQGRL